MGGKLRGPSLRLLRVGSSAHPRDAYEALHMDLEAPHPSDAEGDGGFSAVERVPSAHALREALRLGDAAAAAAAARAPPRQAGAPKAWRRVDAAGDNTPLLVRGGRGRRRRTQAPSQTL
jgi:hypothetical protein